MPESASGRHARRPPAAATPGTPPRYWNSRNHSIMTEMDITFLRFWLRGIWSRSIY